MQQPTDAQLHELAHKRVDFRMHVTVFIIINGVLWFLWFITGMGYIWPIWPTAIWGIGLIFHYVFEIKSPRVLSEEEEYRKLKNLYEKQKNKETNISE